MLKILEPREKQFFLAYIKIFLYHVRPVIYIQRDKKKIKKMFPNFGQFVKLCYVCNE